MPDNERLTKMIEVFRAMEASQHQRLSAVGDPLACDLGFFMDAAQIRTTGGDPSNDKDAADALIEAYAHRGGSLAGIAVALFGEEDDLIDPPCGTQVSRAAELLRIKEGVAEELLQMLVPIGWESSYATRMRQGRVTYQAVADTFQTFRDTGVVEWKVFKPEYRLNKYLTDRAYGGPEEGGWYYDTGRFIEEAGRADTLEEAQQMRERLEAEMTEKPQFWLELNRGHECAIVIEERDGSDYPAVPPVYG